MAQFASVVAEQEGKWRNQVAKFEEDCADPAAVFACRAGLLTLGIMADTTQIVISSAHNPQSKTYLGDPPDEIARLVTETEAAGADVQPAYDAWDAAGCTDPLDDKCIGEYLELERAIDTMTAKSDAWKPYE